MFDTELTARIGWTIVHSFWQLSLVTAIAAFVFGVLHRRSPDLRYVVGCGLLFVGCLLPCLTFLHLGQNQTPARGAELGAVDLAETIPDLPLKASLADTPADSVTASVSVGGSMLETNSSHRGLEVDESKSPQTDSGDGSLPGTFLSAQRMIEPSLSMIVMFWVFGVLIFAFRPLAGFRFAATLRRSCNPNVPDRLIRLVDELSTSLRVRSVVKVAESHLIQVPAVIGTWRPLLLLPPAALSGLTAAELQSVLAHELAHVKRFDYLVNQLQMMGETVFFFHPAFWWLSRRIRLEREHCCDDLAVHVCGDRIAYATALTRLERMRGVPSPMLAANGGPLLGRIRRLAGVDSGAQQRALGASVLLLAMTALALSLSWPTDTVAGELPELDSASWRGRATIDVESRSYVLGENIVLNFGVTNTFGQKLTILEGHDTWGAPRPLRFKVAAWDSNGNQVPDTYSSDLLKRRHGEAGPFFEVAPGETHWMKVPLMRYCDIQNAGEYTVRIYHDLGWDEVGMQEKRILDPAIPSEPTRAPIAETKIRFVRPTPDIAGQIATDMLISLQQGAEFGYGPQQIDLTTLRYAEYRNLLRSFLSDKQDDVAIAAAETLGRIRTPLATRSIIHELQSSSAAGTNALLKELVSRVLTADDTGKDLWNDEARHDAVELACRLIHENELGAYKLLPAKRHRCVRQILDVLASSDNYPEVCEAVTQARLDYSLSRTELNWLAELEWTVLCGDASELSPVVYEQLRRSEAKELGTFTFLRLLRTRPDFRPFGWEQRLADLFYTGNSDLTVLVTESCPREVGRDIARRVARNISPGETREVNGATAPHVLLQRASVAFAQRSRSAYFLPQLWQVVRESKDPEVRAAAREALRSCTPAQLSNREGNTGWPASEYPEKAIDGWMEKFRQRQDLLNAVSHLRDLTGLDFGDGQDAESFRAWHDWWTRERSAIRNTGDNPRDFIVYGRITDPSGKPIPGAWVQAYLSAVGTGSGGGRVAYTLADKNGRYVMRFGFGRRFDLTAAYARVKFSSTDPGYFALRPENEPLDRVISHRVVADDRLLGISKEDALYPGEPLEINFTLHPKTQLKVELNTATGKKIVPHKLQLRYRHNGQVHHRDFRDIKGDYMYATFLPIASGQLVFYRSSESSPIVSEEIALDRIGRFHFTATIQDERIRLTNVLQPDVDNRVAVEVADEASAALYPRGKWVSDVESPDSQISLQVQEDRTARLAQIFTDQHDPSGGAALDVVMQRTADGRVRLVFDRVVIGNLRLRDDDTVHLTLNESVVRFGLRVVENMVLTTAAQPVVDPHVAADENEEGTESEEPRVSPALYVPPSQLTGKSASKAIAELKPEWGREAYGIQFGIARATKQTKFPVVGTIPLTLFVRNVSEQIKVVKLYADFFRSTPTIRTGQEKKIHVDMFYVNGVMADLSHVVTLKPGEAFGVKHPGLTLGSGTEQSPENEPWMGFPRWNNPTTGKYVLTQSHDIVVRSPTGSDRGVRVTMTTGKLPIEIAARGIDSEQARYDLIHEFRQAVQNGHLDKVRKLVDEAASTGLIQSRESEALASSDLKVFRFLQQHWRLGIAPVYEAIFEGDNERLGILLEKVKRGQEKLPGSLPGPGPLHLAVARDNPVAVRLLVEAGVPVDFNMYYHPLPALSLAAERGHTDCVRELLKAGASVNLKADYTAIMRACIGGQIGTARMLIEHGADVNVIRHDGQTALHFAADGGKTDLVRLLLKNGADPLAVAYEKELATDYAVRKGHTTTADVLRDAVEDARITARGRIQKPLIQRAIQRSDLCVTARIDSEILTMFDEAGVANHLCTVFVVNTFKGKVSQEKLRVNLVRLEMTEKDRLPWLKQDAECVLFLKQAPQNSIPQWQTIDLQFGIEERTTALEATVKRVLRQMTRDMQPEKAADQK